MLERTLIKAPVFSSNEEDSSEETLKDEEETSTATGEAEENETESEEDTSINESEESNEQSSNDEESEDNSGEESVEALKARLGKAEADRDNYKRGMLSAKSKTRGETGLSERPIIGDVNEAVVTAVLEKRTEKEALFNTITPGNKDYIHELVDDNQYQQIIGYLPRNVDKTSYESIVRGLKMATKMWKEDKGIKDKSSKKDTGLQTSKSSVASGSKKETDLTGRFKAKSSSYLDWYKKK